MRVETELRLLANCTPYSRKPIPSSFSKKSATHFSNLKGWSLRKQLYILNHRETMTGGLIIYDRAKISWAPHSAQSQFPIVNFSLILYFEKITPWITENVSIINEKKGLPPGNVSFSWSHLLRHSQIIGPVDVFTLLMLVSFLNRPLSFLYKLHSVSLALILHKNRKIISSLQWKSSDVSAVYLLAQLAHRDATHLRMWRAGEAESGDGSSAGGQSGRSERSVHGSRLMKR